MFKIIVSVLIWLDEHPAVALALALCGLLVLLQFPAKPEDRVKIVVGEEFDETPMSERPGAMPDYLPVTTVTAAK